VFYPYGMDLRRWSHRQVILLVWLVVLGLLSTYGDLTWSVLVFCAFVVYMTWLFFWLGRRDASQRNAR
jgi:hypothetical protein